MLTGQKHRPDSDSRSQDVREYHLHSELWDCGIGRNRGWRRTQPQRPSAQNRLFVGAKRQQLLQLENAGHASGLSRSRAYDCAKRFWQRPNKALVQELTAVIIKLVTAATQLNRAEHRAQRRRKAVASVLFSLILACGLACSNRKNGPQVAFDHTYKTFLHGDLKQSQVEAHHEYERFRVSNPELAWKFRILEANSLLWQGMYEQALTTLNSPPNRPNSEESIVQILAIQGVADARLHEFPAAEEKLGQATQMCLVSSEARCGDVLRARGVLAVQRGQIDSAKQFFAQSLEFARAHSDHFLEATALLNLGLTALRQEHFDEAIDWTDAAYQASTTLGADDMAQTALGNRGWAYYKLGDTEKALELSLAAEKGAIQVGDVIDQLTWVTSAGYVYASRRDLVGATQSYQEALSLANNTAGKEAIYDGYRALALVSVEDGKLGEARKYSDEAFAIAHSDNNRLDELYPLLVKGSIAAQSHDDAQAETIFREVELDKSGNASLKWRAEHELARLYEEEGHPDNADREYRTALTTFEAARSSLQRNDSKLPFANNASRIYDDYIHFLVASKKPDDALRWADNSRARTLAEGLGLLPKKASTDPPPLNPQQIARRAGGTILFYWLGEKQSYLWAITPQKTSLFTLPPGAQINAAVERYRKDLGGPQDVLESADSDGQLLYRTLIEPAHSLLNKDAKVLVIPDGSLNNLNFETLLVPEPKLHFWIEDATIADASSLRVLSAARTGYSGPHNKKKSNRSLLLFGNSVSPNDKYPELPQAAAQMESVAKHFPAAQERIFARQQATPEAYLASNPGQFSYIHFVAHGTASRLSPLDSAIVLSKMTSSRTTLSNAAASIPTLENAADDAFKLYARDIIGHPLRADLVTISACYGAGERAYSGEGLVGLSWAFLRAGAHNVIAALWEATDASTEQLMDKFYDELNKGESPETALRTAKLSLLQHSGFHNPFYWAPFQLYTGS
jgi:CHAT domain-containing protein